MIISEIRVFQVAIPFTFSVNHNLKNRNASASLVIGIKNEKGFWGFGEGAPRAYVTHENLNDTYELARRTALKLKGSIINSVTAIKEVTRPLKTIQAPSVACAFELALLDLLGKTNNQSLAELLHLKNIKPTPYSGIISFLPKEKFSGILELIKTLELPQVKIKVGHPNDKNRIQKARAILGSNVDIRLDANCSWNFEEAVEKIKLFEEFKISAIEEPLIKSDLHRLPELCAAIDTPVVLDESVFNLNQAKSYASKIPANKIIFNIKISKSGGILSAQEILNFAHSNNIACQLGCNVGETVILSAAGRIFSRSNSLRYLEGSYANFFMEGDIGIEKLSFSKGGIADQIDKPGLGISINWDKLEAYKLKSENIKIASMEKV